jgi:hypothetical protein
MGAQTSPVLVMPCVGGSAWSTVYPELQMQPVMSSAREVSDSPVIDPPELAGQGWQLVAVAWSAP